MNNAQGAEAEEYKSFDTFSPLLFDRRQGSLHQPFLVEEQSSPNTVPEEVRRVCGTLLYE